MSKKDCAGPDWSAFFGLRDWKDELVAKIRCVLDMGNGSEWDEYHMGKFDPGNEFRVDELYFEACMIELLKYCITRSTFAADLFGEEDAVKTNELLGRGQYNSKLLKSVLSAFLTFLDLYFGYGVYDTIRKYISSTVSETLGELRERKVGKDFLPFKHRTEEVASGVKPVCILNGAKPASFNGFSFTTPYVITDRQNAYIKEKYGYDYNAAQYSATRFSLTFSKNASEKTNEFMETALFPDAEFWNERNPFNMAVFLSSVQLNNGLTHAEKFWDCIFSAFLADPVRRAVIEKGLPIVYFDADAFKDALADRAYRFTFSRFGGRYRTDLVERDTLCYPLGCEMDLSSEIGEGRKLFEKFMHSIYPNAFEHVMVSLACEIKNPHTYVKNGAEWTVRTVIDCNVVGYHTDIWDRDAVEAYCPDFFSEDNLWNRLYLTAYNVSKISVKNGDAVGNFFEVMYDLFQFVEEKFDTRASYVRDREGRDRAYDELKSLISGGAIDITEQYKDDYVVSLLDRKVAAREEAVRFPVLEQLGDAVYGFAVCEMLFYDPRVDDIVPGFEELTNAKAQIKIAKKAGFDRLYLSASGLCEKYNHYALFNESRETYELQEEAGGMKDNRKYLADSLEMVIGTICLDLGPDKAVEFTKKLLRDAYPGRFGEEVHIESDMKKYGKGEIMYWENYWEAVRPGLMSTHLYDSSQQHMWRALEKLLLCLTLKTEDVEARNYISQHFNYDDLFCGDELYRGYYEGQSSNWVFYTYLNEGLGRTLAKYGAQIENNYKDISKKRKTRNAGQGE